MLRTLLLVLGAATPAPGAAPFRVLWDSWFPTECRQFGDKTTAQDFAKFGITATRVAAEYTGCAPEGALGARCDAL